MVGHVILYETEGDGDFRLLVLIPMKYLFTCKAVIMLRRCGSLLG
jgi:hypothetical protein